MTKKVANIIVFTILTFVVLCLVFYADTIFGWWGLGTLLDELLNP